MATSGLQNTPSDGEVAPIPSAGSLVAPPAQRTASEQEKLAAQVHDLAALLELVNLVGSAPAPTEAARILSDHLASHLQSETVIVGLCRDTSGACEVMAVAGGEAVDVEAETTRLATAVLQEGIARGQLSCWPPQHDRRHALLAHRQFARHRGWPCVVSMPLRDTAGVLRGACLLAGDLSLRSESKLCFLSASETSLATSLGLVTRAYESVFSRALKELSARYRSRRGLLLLGSLLALLLLMLVPLRYHVKCDCELQPVIRRFVAAPFDGRLDSTLVEPGDMVAAGDVLARIDGRDIHWELSGKRAQLHQVLKERAGYLAAHQTGKVEIATLQGDRLELQIEQLEDQAANLEIRAAIAGLVVAGDLTKSAGVPLEKGQTLFEIAPLEEMIVEIAIPESDVPFVQAGMAVRVRLDAFPGSPRQGTIQRVHPRAEIRDHNNVFIAEVALDNQQQLLRPGMRGRARIPTGHRSLGWILFHRAIAATLAWLGW